MSILEVDRPEAKVLVLGPALAGTLMTPEEFDRAEEVDRSYTYELIHGVLVVAPPPLEEERGPNFKRTLTACRSDGPDVSVSENGTYTTPLLPGFQLSVGRLFEVADRWRQSKEQP